MKEGVTHLGRSSGMVRRRAAAWLAWSLWTLSVALVTLTVLLDLATPTRSQMDELTWADVLLATLVLTYTTVGAFVASRRPKNPIGWIFGSAGLLIAMGLFFRAYADYVVFVGAGQSVLAEYFSWLSAQLAGPVVVLSTLLLMLLFPTGRVIQSFIDRRFYRSKYDAQKTLERFSTSLRDETDLEALRGDLVGVVADTMQPAHVSLWLRPETARKRERV